MTIRSLLHATAITSPNLPSHFFVSVMPPEAKQHKDVPTYQPDLRDAVIQSGDYVLVQLSSGGISSVKVDSNTCGLLSFSSFLWLM